MIHCFCYHYFGLDVGLDVHLDVDLGFVVEIVYCYFL